MNLPNIVLISCCGIIYTTRVKESKRWVTNAKGWRLNAEGGGEGRSPWLAVLRVRLRWEASAGQALWRGKRFGYVVVLKTHVFSYGVVVARKIAPKCRFLNH